MGLGAEEVSLVDGPADGGVDFRMVVDEVGQGDSPWPSLVTDGSSGTSRGHALAMRRPDCRWNGAAALPSVFRPDVSPGRHAKCECLCVLPTADVCRRLVLLLSRLLSGHRWPDAAAADAGIGHHKAPGWSVSSGQLPGGHPWPCCDQAAFRVSMAARALGSAKSPLRMRAELAEIMVSRWPTPRTRRRYRRSPGPPQFADNSGK